MFAIVCLFVLAASLSAAVRAGQGYLKTDVEPLNAAVFVDGAYQGPASLFLHKEHLLPLEPGVYQVVLKDPRYRTVEATVTIRAGMTSTLQYSMTPLGVDTPALDAGRLKIAGFSNAAIYLNGEYMGTSFDTLVLAPGRYDLKLTASNTNEVLREQSIEIVKDATLIIDRAGAPVVRF